MSWRNLEYTTMILDSYGGISILQKKRLNDSNFS